MEKYTKIKQIGEGSFGKAILVKNKENGEQYVVKEIGISRMKAKERNEARKEVSVLSKMRHPNIVHYTESFEENGHLYIVMEYCDGGDLYAVINKQKGALFSEKQVLDWFVQLCLALKHVHDRKILHRDIKSSNIFLTKSGVIKLGDFGIARVLNNTMELARTCIGTPYYLSPEICENKPYNNKSDVWALGCVVYETLTLKHAFEAGNMKNLVLKIIRGSYPPVSSRYSYDLRSLVSQLFRRNPRERPSINSILKKSFLSPLTLKYLTPEQHNEEFSHTVLHKKGKPPRGAAPVGKYQPFAAKKMRNLEVRGIPQKREQQIAGVYGTSANLKKKPRAANNNNPRVANKNSRVANAQRAVDDLLEQKRKQLIEQERIRKEKLIEEKKKRLEDLQRRQKEREQRLKEEQLRRGRDDARKFNLKRSADLLGNNFNDEPPLAPRPSKDRPISAPNNGEKPPEGNYQKYHEYLDKLAQERKRGFDAEGLAKVKAAWNERNQNQNAILDANLNRAAGEQGAQQAQIVSEYLQRKQEAQMNKQKGQLDLHGGMNKLPVKAGVAGALKPFAGVPARDVAAEQQYLSRLQQIRAQNFNERKALRDKINNQPYKVITNDGEERKRKMKALQEQAQDRARKLKEQMEQKRNKQQQDYHKNDRPSEVEEKKKVEELARKRGIDPDQRPVKFNPNPIGITQALQVVGVAPMEEVTSQSPVNEARKKILQRVNQRYSVDFEEEEKETVEEKTKIVPRPLPVLPTNNKTVVRGKWKKEEEIGRKISELPLQEDMGTYMEGTIGKTFEAKPAQWGRPSGTICRKLDEMKSVQTTLMEEDENTKEFVFKQSEELKKQIKPVRSQSPVKFDIKITEAKTKPPTLSSVEKKKSEEESKLSGNTVVVRKSVPELSDKTQVILAPSFRPVNQTPDVNQIPDANQNKNGTFVVRKSTETTIDDVINKVDDVTIKDVQNTKQEAVDEIKQDSDVIIPNNDVTITNNKVITENDDDITKPIDTKTDNNANDDITEPNIEIPKSKDDSDVTNQNNKSDDITKPNINKTEDINDVTEPHADVTGINNDITDPINDIKDPNHDVIEEISLVAEKIEQNKNSPIRAWDEKPALPPKPKLLPKPSNDLETLEKASPKLPVETSEASGNPLFVKKPLMATSPVVRESGLNRSLYTTASDRVLLKLTMGKFDSPDPKLLRTCSLPDLTKPDHDVRDEDVTDDIVVQSLEFDDDDDEMASSIDVTSSMNDTNFDDCATSSDEELDILRENLENVLLTTGGAESTSPPPSLPRPVIDLSDDVTNEDNDVEDDDNQSDDVINEEWQSDISSSDDDYSDTESVFNQLEHEREDLERELGFSLFLKAYKCVQAIHEDADDEVEVCQSKVRDVLGDKYDDVYRRIRNLVMSDGVYCEDNF